MARMLKLGSGSLLALLMACSQSVEREDAPMGAIPVASPPPGTDAGTTPPPMNKPIELGPCETPANVPADPLQMTQQVNLHNVPNPPRRAHVVEVDVDPETGLVWTMGSGGLFGFTENAGQLSFVSRFDQFQVPGGGGRGRGATWAKLTFLGSGVLAASNRDIGVAFIDASDAANPRAAGGAPIANAAGMARLDRYLYVLTHTGEIVTLDISNVSSPNEVSRGGWLGNPWSMVIAGPYGYVADNALGIVVVDLSDPANPALGAVVAAAGGVQDVSVANGVLYAAAGSAGVEVFALNDPARPASHGTFAGGASIVAVSAANGYLWATNHEDVLVADLQDPLAPKMLGAQATSEWALHVVSRGAVAYVSNWGMLDTYTVDPTRMAPEATPERTEVFFSAGSSQAQLRLENRGSVPLDIAGGSIDDSRFTVTVDRIDVPTGEAATFNILFSDDGQPVDTTLCLATNDPDEPLKHIGLKSTASSGQVAIGQPAPEFVLPNIDGTQTYSLSAQRGNPIVLAYFATW